MKLLWIIVFSFALVLPGCSFLQSLEMQIKAQIANNNGAGVTAEGLRSTLQQQGATEIQITEVAPGSFEFSYYRNGVEPVSGTVTNTSPGMVQGTITDDQGTRQF